MIRMDWLVLVSVVLTVASLLPSIWCYFTGRNDRVWGRFAFFPWIVLVYGAYFMEDKPLSGVFTMIFEMGLVIALFQILADLFLGPRTLDYGDKKAWRIPGTVTPWWMTLLWNVAATQILYFWVRVPALGELFSFVDKYPKATFVVISFVYFLVFELIVNNWTTWWSRRNCWQPFGVAVYALLAELGTVISMDAIMAQLPELADVIRAFSMLPLSNTLIGGTVMGCAITLMFIAFCFALYERQPKPVPVS